LIFMSEEQKRDVAVWDPKRGRMVPSRIAARPMPSAADPNWVEQLKAEEAEIDLHFNGVRPPPSNRG
jgi:hypothetical protein